MYGNNGERLFWLVVLLFMAIVCGGGGLAIYSRGPEAEARAELMLRTPTPTPLPTPNPEVVAARDQATINVTKVGGGAGIALVIVGTLVLCVVAGSMAARAGVAAAVKAKAAKALPPWEMLPDQAVMVALPEGETVFDSRFGSVTGLLGGDKPPVLEQGELLVNRQHPVAEVVQALLAVPQNQRTSAWRAAARYYQLEDGSATS